MTPIIVVWLWAGCGCGMAGDFLDHVKKKHPLTGADYFAAVCVAIICPAFLPYLATRLLCEGIKELES